METGGPTRWARMSFANSLLLVPIAAFGFGEAFWVLVVTNFTLMHAVWISQLGPRGNGRKVDFGAIKWPLVAFAGMGNFSLFVWGDQLFPIFRA